MADMSLEKAGGVAPRAPAGSPPERQGSGHGRPGGRAAGLFALKPVATMLADSDLGDGHGSHLQRTLGLRNLVGFGVGSAVGVSLFVQTGPEAALHAGPAVALSFVLASFACLLAALCYAEFASLVPVAGSAYSYAYATMGEGVAWLIGWCLLLEYLMSGSLVAIGWSGYATQTLHSFGLDLPDVITGAPLAVVGGHVVASGKWFDLPAVLITLFTAYLIMRGTRLSARVNDFVVSLKVIAILAVIIGAAPFIHLHNWVPFVPPNTGVSGSFGVSGVMRAAGILFFAYVGFDSISTLGQETRNPQRTIPLALMISLAVCVLLYVGVALVMTGIADYRTLNVADPIAEAMRQQGHSLDWARWCVSVVAIFGLVSVLLVTLLGQVRIFYAMGRDGLLPPAFSRIHPKYCTPYVGSIVTGIGAALFAGLFPLDLLGDLVSIGTLLAFAVVSAGVLILRRTMPDAPRAFRTPFMPYTPIAAVLACLALMYSLSGDTWVRLVLWLVLGGLVYAFYGYRHSKLRAK